MHSATLAISLRSFDANLVGTIRFNDHHQAFLLLPLFSVDLRLSVHTNKHFLHPPYCIHTHDILEPGVLRVLINFGCFGLRRAIKHSKLMNQIESMSSTVHKISNSFFLTFRMAMLHTLTI